MSNKEYSQLYDPAFLNKFGSKKEEIGQLTLHDDNPVIDLNQIANILGLEVTEEDLAVDGFFKKVDKHIVINQNVSEGRKRFTLAHEIGHSQLGNDEPAIAFRGAESYTDDEQLKEVLANKFAAELLMPNKDLLIDLMKKALCDLGADPQHFGYFERDLALSDVSSRIKVSSEALKFRLLNLNVLRNN
ncbi:hypothetical protein LCIT_19020 [Leuconostoc citreum]|uniref:IrrE N-terminal-like domain-containing protein n=1 Tax=Leuconostoc citreum TaxID=33964 RepID=A0A5A5U0H4_LEUCI|nr:ImmA/IrrE family metallo-endopeptidase [Leuconostoc citreum]GDZ84660.1 hypothetical protein LCIT_19020 [Leuconostoc citreum]